MENCVGGTMREYTFDVPVDRTGSDSLKYDKLLNVFGTKDVMPLWVADMDLPTPDFIMEALRKRCEHPVLGYTLLPKGWFASVQNWMAKRYDWRLSAHDMGFIPGVVSGMAFAIQCFTQPGDNVLIQTPVYPPFFNVPQKNNRKVVTNTLKVVDGKLEIDFEDFEAKAAGCKLFLLCSPHNPGGRIWTLEELLHIAEICRRHDVLVVSDEIHADLALPGQTHLPFGKVTDALSDRVLTLMAPSKAFNIPGLCSSFYMVEHPDIRAEYRRFLEASEVASGNIFAYIATQVAYEEGADWLRQLTGYLQENIRFVDGFLREHVPQIKACIPQASFLIWLDCRELGFSPERLQRFFVENAKLGLNAGHSFGSGGEGFMRINIGCSRSILDKAMRQLKTAVDELDS